MKRSDRIKFNITRNWNLPGKERLSSFLNSSYISKATKNGIAWLAHEDIAIYTTGNSYIEWSILSNGTYEDEIGKLIRVCLREGDYALDIGSNIGLQSIRMSQQVGAGGHVYAFEPLNYLQEKFRKNIALNRIANVTLLPYALSDIENEAEFAVDSQSWNQGAFNLADSQQGTEKQKVTIKIADHIPELDALPSLSLVKIDVEGFECQVLRGMKGLLQKYKPRIIFEYDVNYWTRTSQDIQSCYQFLTDLGYAFYQIDKFGCDLVNAAADLKSGNLFCIPTLPDTI